MKTFTIKKSRFVEWYFEDGQDSENLAIRENLVSQVIEDLAMHGKSTITVEDIFEDCNKGAIKIFYLEEFDPESDDDSTELMDLDYEYKLELID